MRKVKGCSSCVCQAVLLHLSQGFESNSALAPQLLTLQVCKRSSRRLHTAPPPALRLRQHAMLSKHHPALPCSSATTPQPCDCACKHGSAALHLHITRRLRPASPIHAMPCLKHQLITSLRRAPSHQACPDPLLAATQCAAPLCQPRLRQRAACSHLGVKRHTGTFQVLPGLTCDGNPTHSSQCMQCCNAHMHRQCAQTRSNHQPSSRAVCVSLKQVRQGAHIAQNARVQIFCGLEHILVLDQVQQLAEVRSACRLLLYRLLRQPCIQTHKQCGAVTPCAALRCVHGACTYALLLERQDSVAAALQLFS